MTGEPRAIASQSTAGTVPAAVMAGDKGHRRADVAMRDRNAGIGETADPGGDAGHDAERDRGAGQRQSLLAAAPENTGVAALQAQDAATLPRQRDQPGRDVGLARRRPSAALAGIVEHRPGRARARMRGSTSAS